MNDPISHLPEIRAERIRTTRLETNVLMSGPADGEPILLLHGNFSAATIWEETMAALSSEFFAVAPDQRGYGLSDPAVRIDASLGVAEWADDALALANHFEWEKFHLVAHSLGGCVAWTVLGKTPYRLRSAALIAPGPPGGFGGARGSRGELNYSDGAGAGAGLAHQEIVRAIAAGEREISNELTSPRALMRRLFFKPPFVARREEELLTAMLQIHQGPLQFPGDVAASANWPGFAPGEFGPINALAPLHNQGALDRLAMPMDKPSLLWIQGADDAIVSDCSPSDPGYQGKIGLRPDWPGEQEFPPQPVLEQVIHALDVYEQAGGSVTRTVLPDVGHTPFLERPEEMMNALRAHLKQPGG